MAGLVTLQQVKDHLRITTAAGDVEDADLQQKLAAAEGKIVNWCSTTPRAKAVADLWTAATVPPVVTVAILIETGELDRFRGDDGDGPPRDPAGESLTVTVRELLRAYHDVGIG
jgi:hypothetical protein